MLSPVRGMLAQACGCEYLDDFSPKMQSQRRAHFLVVSENLSIFWSLLFGRRKKKSRLNKTDFNSVDPK